MFHNFHNALLRFYVFCSVFYYYSFSDSRIIVWVNSMEDSQTFVTLFQVLLVHFLL